MSIISVDDIFDILPLGKILDIAYSLDNQIKLYDTYSLETQLKTKKIVAKQKRVVIFLLKKINQNYDLIGNRKFNNLKKKYNIK